MNHRTRLAIGSLAIAAALSLSGCFKLDADVTVNQDDTFTGEVTVAFADTFLEGIDESSQEFLEFAAGGSFDVNDYETAPYAANGYSGMIATFDGAPFKQLEESVGVEIERDGDTFVVSGEAVAEKTGSELSGSGPPEFEALVGSMRHSLSITFPGPVRETNGDVDGTTVTWEATGGDPLVVEAVASALTQEELDEIAQAKAEAQAAAERKKLIRNIGIGLAAVVGVALLVALGIFIGRRVSRSNSASAGGAPITGSDGTTTTSADAGATTDATDPAPEPEPTPSSEPSPTPSPSPTDTSSSSSDSSSGSD